MAEIKIERKKSSLPWIILGLVLLAVILYFLFFKNDNGKAMMANRDTTAAAPVAIPKGNDSVAAYIAYVKEDTIGMSESHTYSSEALNKLILATEAVANATGYDVKADLNKAKADADEITKDAQSTDHANKIKNAAGIISTALQNIQKAKYSSLSSEADEVKQAADNLNTDKLTLQQKDAVHTFFDKAANLLQKMN